MEQIDLPAPEIFPPPGLPTNHWKIDSVSLMWTQEIIKISLLGQNGERRLFSYTGPQAATMMAALNTANLSVKSLSRRVLERLVADGKLPGTVSGTP
jgi:hypothetical protein